MHAREMFPFLKPRVRLDAGCRRKSISDNAEQVCKEAK
jgi:hypothetical protein